MTRFNIQDPWHCFHFDHACLFAFFLPVLRIIVWPPRFFACDTFSLGFWQFGVCQLMHAMKRSQSIHLEMDECVGNVIKIFIHFFSIELHSHFDSMRCGYAYRNIAITQLVPHALNGHELMNPLAGDEESIEICLCFEIDMNSVTYCRYRTSSI